MKFPGKCVDNMIEVAHERFIPYRIIRYDRKEKLIPWKI